MSPQIIFIEGNIAVGKSTILKALARCGNHPEYSMYF